MKRKALVTGATGYIGSNLCQSLLDDKWNVEVLVRKSSSLLVPILASKVASHVYDGSTESVLEAVKKSKPDIVFHIASRFIAEHQSADISDLISSNILYGTQLVEACVQCGVKCFLNTGTSWQHYRSSNYDPVCLYAATKQAFEDILDFYSDAYSLRVINLKLFETYGPNDMRPKLINFLIKTALTGERLGISPGNQALDLVYITDVTNAFICCAHQLIEGVEGEKFNKTYAVSSGVAITVRQIIEIIEKCIGHQVNVSYGARPYRKREVMMPWQDSRTPPGWDVTIDLKNGITLILESKKSS